MAQERQAALSSRCSEALASLAAERALVMGDHIKIGGTEVALAATVEQEENAGGKFLVGIRVEVSIDDVPQPLTAGSIGVGDNREDAIDTAIFEWAQLVGVALVGALKRKPTNVHAGPFPVYPGATGFRGSGGTPWSDDDHRQLLRSLAPVIDGLQDSPGEFHAISIMLQVYGGVARGGECRIDGAVSLAATMAMSSFSWPYLTGNYLLKQFYVLKK